MAPSSLILARDLHLQASPGLIYMLALESGLRLPLTITSSIYASWGWAQAVKTTSIETGTKQEQISWRGFSLGTTPPLNKTA